MFTDGEWADVAEHLKLSRRELDIARCVFDDLKEASIAEELGISSHTVHTHLERLYRKVKVTSRCELVIRIMSEWIALVQPHRA